MSKQTLTQCYEALSSAQQECIHNLLDCYEIDQALEYIGELFSHFGVRECIDFLGTIIVSRIEG